ncbi:MAG: hypothetical protein R3212_00700 [Xanthomonadales bacterium]|nr:hypothetical protein [Xanthomonadales bacterium]
MDSASAGSGAQASRPVQQGLVSGGGSPGRKSARLFPELFRGLDPTERLKVLEIGRAQPETVEFFSRFKCRLQFADLYSASELLESQSKCSEAELAVAFRKALDIPKEARFDLCLFWDIMQYLTPSAIRALCGVLEPHIHKQTRAHAFGVHSILTACERAEYAIAGPSEFKLKKGRLPDLQYMPHPQAELSELLKVFKIERAMLMADGTVEMLLGHKPYWD